jgi:lipopolysaccharide/colanic/teichoic acid biosynthesis glycosyltransferase
MLVAVIGTKLSSPGPVIFKQDRIGYNNKPFTMYKFRSMRMNDVADTQWTTLDDPRKTKFGSFIRKTSIDELPQFVNALKGDMSIVGPRPERDHFVEQFRTLIPKYMMKHRVKPGITGWAQVNGLRGDTSIEERIKYDLYYMENWSLSLDMKIMWKTLTGGMVNPERLK